MAETKRIGEIVLAIFVTDSGKFRVGCPMISAEMESSDITDVLTRAAIECEDHAQRGGLVEKKEIIC